MGGLGAETGGLGQNPPGAWGGVRVCACLPACVRPPAACVLLCVRCVCVRVCVCAYCVCVCVRVSVRCVCAVQHLPPPGAECN